MRLLIIFIILISNSYAGEDPIIKNLIISKELKKYDSVTFLDQKNIQLFHKLEFLISHMQINHKQVLCL